MSPETFAITFVIFIILAHWAIRIMGDWFYPRPNPRSPQSDLEFVRALPADRPKPPAVRF